MAKRRFVRPQALGHRACGPFPRLNVEFRLLTWALAADKVDTLDYIKESLLTDKVDTILGCKLRR